MFCRYKLGLSGCIGVVRGCEWGIGKVMGCEWGIGVVMRWKGEIGVIMGWGLLWLRGGIGDWCG